MAKLKVKGLSFYSQQLQALERDAEPIIKKCVYEGAAVMADAIKAAIDTIPTRSSGEWGTSDKPVSGLLAIQKEGLKYSFGISKMSDRNNMQSVKCGFDGYNKVVTKEHKNGEPNQLIARAIESGTSWLQPCHFMSKAINANKEAVLAKMQEVCDVELAKRTNN